MVNSQDHFHLAPPAYTPACLQGVAYSTIVQEKAAFVSDMSLGYRRTAEERRISDPEPFMLDVLERLVFQLDDT